MLVSSGDVEQTPEPLPARPFIISPALAFMPFMPSTYIVCPVRVWVVVLVLALYVLEFLRMCWRTAAAEVRLRIIKSGDVQLNPKLAQL